MSERWLIIAAFAAVYIIWGSTYLFNDWAIQAIPPFLMSGSRFFTAGLLLYAWQRWRGQPRPTLPQWRNSIVLGILFLSLGTGAVVWALQWIDTGIAALIVATEPLVIMFLIWLLLGNPPRWMALLGAGIGIFGMYRLIDGLEFVNTADTRWALLAILVAMVSWALASIYVSRVDLPNSRPMRSALQMIGGGAALVLYSLITNEVSNFHWQDLSLKSVMSWSYLIIFGSIIAFSSFNFLLAKVSPEKVVTSTYVNPVVALFLGWAFNGEAITQTALIAGGLLLMGVFLINSSKAQDTPDT